jgi:hypothetical protein
MVPSWLRKVLLPDNVGPTYIAETYEVNPGFMSLTQKLAFTSLIRV